MAPSHVYVWTCADPAKNKKRVAMQGGGGVTWEGGGGGVRGGGVLWFGWGRNMARRRVKVMDEVC